MANTIKIKRSAVQGKVPAVGDLSLGELALNTYDGKLYTLKNDGANSVVEIGASSGASFSTDISLQNQSATRYYEASANGTNYIAIRAPSALSTDVTLTLPTTDGDADQVLATDGSGNLSWVSRVGGSGTTGDFLSSSTASEQSGYFGNVYLKDDSNTSHYLEITNSADLTALRTLSINVNDVNRTISLSGNLTVSSVATISGTNTGDQTITLTGDVTGSGTGSFAATIAADAVTYAKIQNVSATDRILGRSTAGAGDIEEITCTAAGRALLDDADAAAQRTTLNVPTRTGGDASGTWSISVTGAASSNVLKAGDTMTGALAVPLASAATPSLTFTGDPNTGIFSPGADQVAISTNGVGRLSISSAGEVTTTNEKLNLITVGRGAGAISTNTAVGTSALAANTTGGSNTANGFQALLSNTTGFSNTANGRDALQSNTTGGSNTANGRRALRFNTTGVNNTANGRDALHNNTTGVNNTANGVEALRDNTTGDNNTANGRSALRDNTTGNENTANGVSALRDNTTGNSNTANGVSALRGNTTGNSNTANGRDSLVSNTTGNNNTCYGFEAGKNLTTGSNNTIIGNILGTAGLANTVIIGAGATERLRIDSSGALLVGTSTARVFDSANGTLTPITQIESTGAESAFSITRNSAAAVGPGLFFGKSRSGAVGGTVIVQNGDRLGTIFFEGTDGTNLIEAATIFAQVDGSPGANDMPGRLVFSTTADGAASPTERVRIASTGAIGLSGANYGTTGQVLTSNGSATAPTWGGGGGVDAIEVMLFG